ncbi:protein eva-1-like isoform X4 [Drosophila albomicans]|uniref:Protein eva-1-like isoform X4 n=1 Tax=Drosophila albomicans TaxID=7291 RepID=A0A6P8ZDC3_DROAB|nr:protein eva-1-like isoform X4 [Drosophila albomicans]
MAESQPNPAQHLQRQRPQLQLQHQLRLHHGSKCRHVHCENSWSVVGWRRFAWLLAVVCLLTRPVMPEVIYRVDPLALLAATLRTYQRAGCDSEQLSLSCPRGTSISIELAQYGRAGDLSDHSLCPPVSQEDLTTTGSAGDAVIHSGTEIEVKPPETCTVSGLQYALLQTVVDACQKKRHCKFAANSKTHTTGDPCSGIRKFVEIAYKCRPYEFRSKLACENDNMPLMCNPYSRIAIYSASFGHTEKESVQCGNPGQTPAGSVLINREDAAQPTCLVSYATETVMQICHGRRRCSVTADAGTFGRPCKNDVRMYLKVVYTCIPRKVLKDRYETAPEADEPHQTDLDLDQDELYDEDQFYKESEAIPPAPKLQGANSGRPFDFDHSPAGEESTSTLLPPLLSRNEGSLEEHQEQFYLYLIISVTAGVLLCLTIVIGRLTLQKRGGRKKRSSSVSNVAKNFGDSQIDSSGPGGVGGGTGSNFQQLATGETHLADSFGDDISDIDVDVDLTAPMPLSSLSSRNEASYMTYAPTPNYAGLQGAQLHHPSASSSTATSVLMQPPTQGNIYTSMGHPAVSGAMTIGPHMLGPSGMGGVSPAYISGTIMVPGHQHTHGTLRRTLIPTSMGLMSSPSPPPAGMGMGMGGMGAMPAHSMASTGGSGGHSVYYDSTVPRTLARGMSTESSGQYFYG